MLRTSVRYWVILAGVTLLSAPAWAGGRPDDSSRSWFGHIGGGWAFPSGDSGDVLDDDWTFNGGAMYWPSDWPVGLVIDGSWVDFDLTRSAINSINDAIDQDPNNDGSISGGPCLDHRLHHVVRMDSAEAFPAANAAMSAACGCRG
jgi:hypothetical protein